MVHPDTDPACVGRQVVEAVGHRAAEFGLQEVVYPHLLRVALRPPFAARVLEVADQLLLLGVDRDHRLLLPQRRRHAGIDVSELRIPVRMLAAFARLAVGLQAELLLRQQLAHHRAADRMATLRQLRRQPPQALAGPAQGRHRVAPRLGFHQRQQRGQQPRVALHGRLAAAALPAHPSRRQLVCQILQATANRARRQSCRPRHCRDPAIARSARFRGRQQPTTTLVQMHR